jgi:hypothetical protein
VAPSPLSIGGHWTLVTIVEAASGGITVPLEFDGPNHTERIAMNDWGGIIVVILLVLGYAEQLLIALDLVLSRLIRVVDRLGDVIATCRRLTDALGRVRGRWHRQ